MEALDVFHQTYGRQVLGMGDIVSLVERRKNNSMSRKLSVYKRRRQRPI